MVPAAAARPPVLKLPNMNEFARGTLGDLRPVISLVRKFQPDRAAIVAAIAASAPKIAATPGSSKATRADNVLIGMSQCGLFDKGTKTLTKAGEELADEPDEKKFYRALAKHLITYPPCHVPELLEAAGLVRARGEEPTLRLVREQLKAMGFVLTHNEGNASKLRAWLEPSGVVNDSWNVNEKLMADLAGITLGDASAFARLSRAQQAFLKVLRKQVAGGEWVPTSHVLTLAEFEFTKNVFPEGNVRARVLDPLERGGWIETRGKGPGRGGKSGEVRATRKLLDITAELSVEAAAGSMIPRDLIDRESVPLSKLYEDLDSPNTGVKGLALELLAMKVARGLDLHPVKFHLRAASTGGAEVDLVAEGLLVTFARWLFQCKAKGHGGITVSEVSKEVGLADVLGAHIIMMVTTGTIKGSVREFAKRVAAATEKQVYLLDGAIMEQFRETGPQRIVDEVKRQAVEIQKVKRAQIDVVKLDDLE
jgi:hypothetical protein